MANHDCIYLYIYISHINGGIPEWMVYKWKIRIYKWMTRGTPSGNLQMGLARNDPIITNYHPTALGVSHGITRGKPSSNPQAGRVYGVYGNLMGWHFLSDLIRIVKGVAL